MTKLNQIVENVETRLESWTSEITLGDCDSSLTCKNMAELLMTLESVKQYRGEPTYAPVNNGTSTGARK